MVKSELIQVSGRALYCDSCGLRGPETTEDPESGLRHDAEYDGWTCSEGKDLCPHCVNSLASHTGAGLTPQCKAATTNITLTCCHPQGHVNNHRDALSGIEWTVTALEPTDERFALDWLLTSIGCWTTSRWDQHLRHRFGDLRTDRIIEALGYINRIPGQSPWMRTPED